MEIRQDVLSFYGISLTILVLLCCVIAGCTQTGGVSSVKSPGLMGGPGGCNSPESCEAYCKVHIAECEQSCRDHPERCPAEAQQRHSGPVAGGMQGGQVTASIPRSTAGIPPASSATSASCSSPVLAGKLKSVIDRVMVNPPSSVRGVTWMTKILPTTNPFPGYYYTIGTAFGPATEGTMYSGEGKPALTPGQYYCSFGFWESVPAGKGAAMAAMNPDTIDLSRYDMTIFYTNVAGDSQYDVIQALPELTMTEEQARAEFYKVFRKEFLNIDNRIMTREGNRLYEIAWNDSPSSKDYWVVQIGTGYIAIGQGKVNYEESELAKKTMGGDPGTMWIQHACRPCNSCLGWTDEKEFNKYCSKEGECLGGLSCSGGYCVDPKSAAASSSSSPAAPTGAPADQGAGGPGNTGAPGSSCSGSTDCASGLTCKVGVCAVPGGP
jgi:hypothetical protein